MREIGDREKRQNARRLTTRGTQDSGVYIYDNKRHKTMGILGTETVKKTPDTTWGESIRVGKKKGGYARTPMPSSY